MNPLLETNNYIFIPNFISRDRAISYGDQFKEFSQLQNIAGDHQVENSRSYYNFKPFLKLVCEKLPEVSNYSGFEALPVCAYSRVYRNGNVLKRHRDRPGCEISITLNLSGDHPWPIGVQKPDGTDVMVDLNPGDAIMYRGYHADHWRDSYQGHEYIQVFMHYVDAKGPFSKEHLEFVNYINHHFL